MDKAELRKKIDEAKTPEELQEIRKQIEELQKEEATKEKEEPKVDERSLLKEAIDNLESRSAKLGDVKVIKKAEEERKMEENNEKEYRSAFLKKLQGKKLTDAEERAMSTATNSNGAAVPTTTLNKIEEKLRQTSALYNRVDAMAIPGFVSIPAESVVNDADWIEEGKDSTVKDDKLTPVNLAAYKLIRTIRITAELSAMSIDAFEAWIVKKMVDKIAIALENAILNGTGVGQPKGILKESLTLVKPQETNKISYQDICNIMAKLKAGYKKNAAFTVSTETLWSDIASITDGNKPVFVPDPTGEFTGRIFGKPVIEHEQIEEGKILIGDFEAYKLNFSQAIEIKSDESAAFASGDKLYRGMTLVDGKTANPEAFVLFDKKQA